MKDAAEALRMADDQYRRSLPVVDLTALDWSLVEAMVSSVPDRVRHPERVGRNGLRIDPWAELCTRGVAFRILAPPPF